MPPAEATYLPAANRDFALPIYDPILHLLGADSARIPLLQQAELRSGHRVLDIGCGTGTLATTIKRLHPGVEVVALDPDPKALVRARRKAQRAGIAIEFEHGFSEEMPYPAGSFDRVFSSYMFHHVAPGRKVETLREVRRVLARGGGLHLLDFEDADEEPDGVLARLVHKSRHLAGNSQERILDAMAEAGFPAPKRITGGAMLFGALRYGYYEAALD